MRAIATVKRIPLFSVCLVVACTVQLAAEDSALHPTQVNRPSLFDISPPLRTLAALPSHQRYNFHGEADRWSSPFAAHPREPRIADAVEQRTPGGSSNISMGLNLLGLGFGFPGYTDQVDPSDSNLAVGDTQVVEWVNYSYEVFDKKTGGLILGPIEGNQLWSGFSGSACATYNDGDIIVLWDKMAHRWLMSQLEIHTSPWHICLAVSSGPDATGSYYRYQYNVTTALPDYPKWGVWPNGYYQTANGNAEKAQIAAYNRAKILVGDPSAEQIFWQLTTADLGILPADLDSPTPPPANQDEFLIGGLGKVDNYLSLYSVHPDFENPQNSILTGANNSQLIQVAAFNPACNGVYEPPPDGACVPQPAQRTCWTCWAIA